MVEYDGSYWHAHKTELDSRKTVELLDAGYRVVRIRENDLAHLPLAHPRLRQVSYWPASSNRQTLMDELLAWARPADPPRAEKPY